jgi:transcriptional regulator with XRE-family HTH domain
MIKNLPEKLKKLRIHYNLSQKEVANKLNISPSIVSAYETGERTPSTEILLALSYLYKCSTDYLLGKESTESSSIDTNGLTPEQIQAVNNLIKVMKHE